MRVVVLQLVILSLLSFIDICLTQRAPVWGDPVSCDSSFVDRFPPGSQYATYWRLYTLTTSYSTLIRRDIRVSMCIEKSPEATLVEMGGSGRFRVLDDPENANRFLARTGFPTLCGNEQLGNEYYFDKVPAGDWSFGVKIENQAPYNSNEFGGKYHVSIQCIDNPTEVSSLQYKSNNVTQEWSKKSVWQSGGSKTISCGVSAFGSAESADYYQYTVTDWAKEIIFTTCDVNEYFDIDNWSNINNNQYGEIPYDGSDIRIHSIYQYSWDFPNRQWNLNPSPQSNDYGCTAIRIGDRNDPTSSIVDVSPGTYYVGIESAASQYDGKYVLSMICWNNDDVKTANNYKIATYSPTKGPTTSQPTVKPTAAPSPTNYPSQIPTVSFYGTWSNSRKTIDRGTISCGIHKNDMLQKKRSNFYTFEILVSGTQIYFDSCMNDVTDFDAKVSLYRLNQVTGKTWVLETSQDTYCTIINTVRGPGIYAIEIYGEDPDIDYGHYILRMGCDLNQYDNVVAVSETDAPSPSPTSYTAISPRDGRIAGDISCGITVAGTTSSEVGDFHKFTVIGGGIEWVKFDTCDETSFENYLFVYDYWNQTGVEQYTFGRDNSVGFHYEDSSTCNSITMNDLTPGIYYVNIDGFNYYFDYGDYTISMQCSNNNAIASASNYNEYSPGLEWWAILLIVLSCLLCCGCIIFAICYYKKKQGGGGGGAASSQQTEMAGGDGDGDGTTFAE